jgi:hypothetical protein
MKKIIVILSLVLLPIVSTQSAHAQPCKEILNAQGNAAVGCVEPSNPLYLALAGVGGGAPECTVNAGALRVNGEFYPSTLVYRNTKVKTHLNGERVWNKYTGPTTSGGTINARFMLYPANNEYLSRTQSLSGKLAQSIEKCRQAEIANGNWEMANRFYEATIPGYVRR